MGTFRPSLFRHQSLTAMTFANFMPAALFECWLELHDLLNKTFLR